MVVEERRDGPLLVRLDQRIALLTLNAPPMNPVSREMVTALEEVTAAIAADAAVRAVVISGSGGHFCAGADIKQFRDIGVVETEEGYFRRRSAMVTAIESLPKPVIAVVRGNCLGGGFEIALASHLRLADPTARFGVPEIKLGVMPSWGGTQRLSRLVRRDVALRMLLTADPVAAPDALALGLITELHDADALEDAALAWARRLATQPRAAVAAILDSVVRGGDLPLAAGLDVEIANALACRNSADAREGSRAFIEKRPPRFE
jgi:enoyl-CoA hydratase/carnithine racemase